MALSGPILVIEDDPNDTDVISAGFKELGVKNAVIPFNNAHDALDYLKVTTDKPLIILCDIRMPGMDGLAFLRYINNNQFLKKKTIPFIFFSELATPEIINTAYELGVQGFYKKATSFIALKDQLLAILVYWKHCLHPNS